MSDRAFDPELDLVLEREVPIAPNWSGVPGPNRNC